ncbi:MAG: EAL domain-containing protein, partial [Oxalobacteraceae bacterium]
MLRVLDCVASEHNFWLVALSAVICILGCFTTTTLMARSVVQRSRSNRTLLLAAMVFGSSVWSLHFVAMLAFVPAQRVTYAVSLTIVSALVAILGAYAALIAWQSKLPRAGRVLAGGVLFGLGVASMHYLGVAAMEASSILSFEYSFVLASVVISIMLFITGLFRATDLTRVPARLEFASWMASAICILHFTGMAAVTVTPLAVDATAGLIGSTTLGIAVGSVAIMVEQHLSQRALKELDRMRLMGNLANEVVLIYTNGIIVEVNSAGERLRKAAAIDIIGQSILSLFTQTSVPALLRREHCAPGDRRPEEMEFQAIDGTSVPVEWSCQPIDYMGKLATVVSLRDLTARKRDEARILHLARHDALTGLPNRHALLEYLNNALAAAAHDGTAIALGFIDLDRFKLVNDLYGHATGDAVLIQAAARIKAELRPTDILARIGGDEFIMILIGDPSPEKTSVIATRAIDALRQPFQIGGRLIKIGASIGVALYPDDAATTDALMNAADTAMYRVKESGRGALRFFEAAMNEQLQSRLQLEEELAGAADRGELILLYQPIVNGSTGELENFEALIRWHNPRLGTVSPAEFIPLAEETGLIDRIGRWVLDNACAEAATWPEPWRVSVNVSPRQFHACNVCEVIANALRKHALDPSRLVVEVTEGVLIDDAVGAVATLQQLRSLGVQIALDDFGTGYSSLSYLQRFRFDKFKIDQSFI